jgi:radical SAM superfamily enzyme YgiQ (UPF0313 family)
VTCSPKRARELVDGIKALKRPVAWSVSTRFDILERVDDELLREMKATGCRIMGPGIESGSDRILQVMDKRITRAMIVKGLERLRKVGILPTGSIMVGQYSETREDVEQSISLVRETVRENPNLQYAFCLCTPFPGSKLHRQIFEERRLRDEQEFYDRYFHYQSHAAAFHSGDFNPVVNLTAMREEEVQEMFGKIVRAYAEAKRAHACVRASAPVERLEQCIGLANWYLLPKPLKNTRPYLWVQERLDRKRLRIRGVG